MPLVISMDAPLKDKLAWRRYIYYNYGFDITILNDSELEACAFDEQSHINRGTWKDPDYTYKLEISIEAHLVNYHYRDFGKKLSTAPHNMGKNPVRDNRDRFNYHLRAMNDTSFIHYDPEFLGEWLSKCKELEKLNSGVQKVNMVI